jgi:HK97 family phage portal protein
LKGGEKLKFFDWVKSFFGVNQNTITFTQQQISSQEEQLAIELFAISVGINLIAGAISKCEFKTYLMGEDVKKDEYYLWNIEPNKNQNSSQFIYELVQKILFNNEALVIFVNNQLIIADSFTQNEFALYENTFTSVSKGTMNFERNFKMSEVLYYKLGDIEIKNLLSNLINGYNKLLNTSIDKYKTSGGRKGILDIDALASGDAKFKEKLDDLMNVRFKRYFESRNAVLPLHKGFHYTEQDGDASKRASNEIADVQSITKEIFERVGQAMKIPPVLLRGDIAEVDKAVNSFLTFGVDPLASMISEEITRKRYQKNAFLKGSYLRVDTTSIKHIDIFGISESFDKLIASGGYSVDELREKVGDAPINEKWSKKHWITKNYQDVNAVEGGEM